MAFSKGEGPGLRLVFAFSTGRTDEGRPYGRRRPSVAGHPERNEAEPKDLLPNQRSFNSADLPFIERFYSVFSKKFRSTVTAKRQNSGMISAP